MKKGMILVLSLFLFSSFAIPVLGYGTPTGEESEGVIAVEWDDIGLTGSMAFGPGSEILVYDPIDSEGTHLVFVSNREPIEAVWKVYTPSLQKVYENSHVPSFKQSGSFEVGGQIYRWAFADEWAWTVPAFAEMGDWLLSPSYKMSDGGTQSGAYTYYAVPITQGGDAWTNLFGAPWYLAGFEMPPLFWFPLCLLWIPALFIIISAIYVRSISGFVLVLRGIRDSTREARGKWK